MGQVMKQGRGPSIKTPSQLVTSRVAKRKTTVTFEVDVLEDLQNLAVENKIDASTIINYACSLYLKRLSKKFN